MILDANALLLPFRVGLSLEREVGRLWPGAEIVVPDSVLAELSGLAARGVRHASAARQLGATFRSLTTGHRGDAAVLECALREHAAVVTADADLTRRLVARGITVFAPRDRARLDRVVRPQGGRPAPSTARGPRAAATVKKRTRLESRRAPHARRRPSP